LAERTDAQSVIQFWQSYPLGILMPQLWFSRNDSWLWKGSFEWNEVKQFVENDRLAKYPGSDVLEHSNGRDSFPPVIRKEIEENDSAKTRNG